MGVVVVVSGVVVEVVLVVGVVVVFLWHLHHVAGRHMRVLGGYRSRICSIYHIYAHNPRVYITYILPLIAISYYGYSSRRHKPRGKIEKQW